MVFYSLFFHSLSLSFFLVASIFLLQDNCIIDSARYILYTAKHEKRKCQIYKIRKKVELKQLGTLQELYIQA